GRQTTRCCGKNLCGPTLTGSSQRSWLKGDEPLLGLSRSPSHGSKFSVFFLWDSMRDDASSLRSSQHTSPSFAKRYGGLFGPWRHLGPGWNIQATRPASALPHQSCARSAGDRRVPRAFFLLRRCDRSAGAMASVENAAGATGRGRAHGTEQLSVSV